MEAARTRSPFAQSEEPWTLWTNRESVLNLPEEYNIRLRSVLQEKEEPTEIQLPRSNEQRVDFGQFASFGISRKQYDAVVSRMQQAKKQTGIFTAWTT